MFFEDEPPSSLGRDTREKQKAAKRICLFIPFLVETTPSKPWIAEPRSGGGNPCTCYGVDVDLAIFYEKKTFRCIKNSNFKTINTTMTDNNYNVEALTTILSVLKELDMDSKRRTIQAVITFLDIPSSSGQITSVNSEPKIMESVKNDVLFSENRSITAKDFIREKAPKTDIERIACLAYYLTNYRDTPHFKTLDLSSLNTEAAQPKLSNAAYAVDNATKAGLLVQALKGSKQLSATGEYFVQALPDREAAKSTLSDRRFKRRAKKSPPKKISE